MASFKPGEEITIEGDSYRVAPHPSAPKLPFAQQGRKGTVYQIVRQRDKHPFALKVFVQRFRDARMLKQAKTLSNYATMPGLAVCRRDVLSKAGFGRKTVQKHPDLEFAVLMPWSVGRTWFDVLCSGVQILPSVGIEIARRVANILVGLESKGLAHCDVASGNLLVSIDTLDIYLIDVEDMYGSGFDRPSAPPAGSDGYNHRQVRDQDQWRAAGDRFAGAVIMAEMLCWHHPAFRESSTEDGSFFAAEETQDASLPKYTLLLDTLRTLPNVPDDARNGLVALFERAWLSPTLEDCPTLAEWAATFDLIPKPTTQLKLTDDKMAWPVVSWKAIKPAIPTSPIVGFSGSGNTGSTTAVLRAPRIIPMSPFARGSVLLRWMGVAGAVSYEVEVAASTTFDSPRQVHQGSAITATLDGLTPGLHYLRIRAIGPNGEKGGWSEIQQLEVRA
jgi:hypothetical protein